MAFEQDAMSANVGNTKGDHVVRVAERTGQTLTIRVERPKGTGLALYDTMDVSLAEAKALWPLLRSMTNS